MGTRYVEVPADAIRDRLKAAGFVLANSTGEEVYERCHDKDRRYVIRVFSSLARGAQHVRACGADAIRTVVVFRPDPIFNPREGVAIFKGTRVFRTGSVEKVLERMIERARAGYSFTSKYIFSRGIPPKRSAA